MGLTSIAQFHFLHPLFLLALPLLLLLAARWRRFSAHDRHWLRLFDAPLLATLRLTQSGRTSSPWPVVIAVWLLGTLALAGPAWQRAPAAAYHSPASWVLLFDLSPSMNTADVSPDRATRARYAAADVLSEAHGARVGLIAFSGDAYTVAPLTSDIATLQALLRPLAPQLMPEHGDELAPALAKARDLLIGAQARDGQVVVLTDGFDDPAAALTQTEQLRQAGMTVNIVGVGTHVPSDQLQRIAGSGNGLYVPLSDLPTLTRHLQREASDSFNTVSSSSSTAITQWRNEGVWLLIPILLLGTMLARRGWI